jgi:hypothetical protein
MLPRQMKNPRGLVSSRRLGRQMVVVRVYKKHETLGLRCSAPCWSQRPSFPPAAYLEASATKKMQLIPALDEQTN